MNITLIKAALLILLRMACIVSLVLLLFISGAVAQNGWAVNYNPTSICALRWSTVTMGCTYKYPRSYSVLQAFWTKHWIRGAAPPNLLGDPQYRGRAQYLGDKYRYCTLRLRDVTEKDQSKYYFTFITRTAGRTHQGEGGVELSVTGLQVEVPERVMEGGKVTLTCKTTCSLTVRPTFTWYRGGHRLSSSTDQLYLQPVSREDAGRYHCAVLDQNLHSPEVTLNVRFGPKSVSVSISPSGKIVEGSSVTLTCSSDADPPVDCTWFKGASLVVRGETYTMEKISSVDSGGYRCRCSNEHGEKDSEAVSLNVLHPPKSVSVSISPSGYIVEGISVTLTCSSEANPPVQNYTWYKETLLIAKGENYTINMISSVDSGEYTCTSSNGHWEKNSEALTLNVLYPPKSVLVSISPSGKIMEGSSVTLTCSSDANPPVQNYTWFKEGETTPVGTEQNYSLSADSKVGGYYCVAQNECGCQKSAVVLMPSRAECSMLVYAVIGLSLCLLAVLLLVAFLKWNKKKQRRMTEKYDCQNVTPYAKDDTYTALDPRSMSCHIYDTLATFHSSPSDDPDPALNPQSSFPEYKTRAVSEHRNTSGSRPRDVMANISLHK